jgi:hypothetical protein
VRKVHELGLIPHEKYPWLGGSPDGLTESNCLVEIKCPMMKEDYTWGSTEHGTMPRFKSVWRL